MNFFSKVKSGIKQTNGDILGVFLFLLLAIHFIILDEWSYFNIFLFLACIVGLIVDSAIVYRVLIYTKQDV